MILRKHIPNCCSGVEPEQWAVKSTADLLLLDWVSQWGRDDFESIPFFRFSQSKHGKEYLLMGEWKNKNGHKWWVIGYISEKAELPEFKAT